MKQAIFSIIAAAIFAGQASAAPIWLERRFIPDAELVDQVFLEHAEEGSPVYYNDWAEFLNWHVIIDEAGVARIPYGDVTAETKRALTAFIASLEQTDVTKLTRPQQLAFWINLYNAATVRLVLENYPVKSIRKIDDPWDTPVATLNGVTLTLNQIEHGIIRPVFKDSRIHYAVNCASVGCPNLANAPYSGDEIDAQLTAAARAYVNDPRGVSVDEDGDITVSKIYGWYREDFGKNEAAVLKHIRQFADPNLRQALEGADDINDYEYDWDLNELR